MPCSGRKLSQRDPATTYNSAADFIPVIIDSEPAGEKLKRMSLQYVFSGWTAGDMNIRNNTNSGKITFSGKNSSGVLKTPMEINFDTNAVQINGFLSMNGFQTYGIISGAVTVNNSFASIDTEGLAASDDLDTIYPNTGNQGFVLIVKAQDINRTVVVKHGTGNIFLQNLTDFSLDSSVDRLTLLGVGASWIEISRSNNGV